MIKKSFAHKYVLLGLWAAFIAYGLFLFQFGVYPGLKLLSSGMELPEELFGATWEYQTVFLDQVGQSGVAAYSSFQWFDFVNALLMGLVLSATIFYLLNKLEAAKPILFVAIVPLIAALFDFLENGVMLANLGRLPDLDQGLSSAFMRFTQIKLALGVLSVLIAVTCVVALVVTSIGKKVKK